MYRFFILILVILSACQSPQKIEVKKVEKTQKLQDSFSFAFVGDVIIHERLRKREDLTKEGYDVIWSDVQKYLNKTDFTYANLEGPVAPEYGGVSGFPKFNFPEKIIPALTQSGFNIVSTANNHALDRNARGVRKTIQNLKKYNLSYTGTASTEKSVEANLETWWHLSRLTPESQKLVAWLSCTEMTNGIRDKEHQVLYCFKDLEKVKSLIQELKKNKDVVAIILLPHWGEEEKFEIESYRQRWAHILLDLGASLVVGSHPHVVQKIEEYVTKDKRQTYIAYSLGNFISNQPWSNTKTSMILYFKLKLEGQKNQYEFEEPKYLPIWMNRTIDKNGSSKFRLSAVYEFKNYPADAVKIWTEQLGDERRLKDQKTILNYLHK